MHVSGRFWDRSIRKLYRYVENQMNVFVSHGRLAFNHSHACSLEGNSCTQQYQNELMDLETACFTRTRRIRSNSKKCTNMFFCIVWYLVPPPPPLRRPHLRAGCFVELLTGAFEQNSLRATYTRQIKRDSQQLSLSLGWMCKCIKPASYDTQQRLMDLCANMHW